MLPEWGHIQGDVTGFEDIFENDENGEIQFDFICNIKARLTTAQLIERNEYFMAVRFGKAALTDKHIVFDPFYDDELPPWQPPKPDMVWFDEVGDFNMADIKTWKERQL